MQIMWNPTLIILDSSNSNIKQIRKIKYKTFRVSAEFTLTTFRYLFRISIFLHDLMHRTCCSFETRQTMWSLSRNSVGRGRSDLARSSSCFRRGRRKLSDANASGVAGKGRRKAESCSQTAALDAARSCDPGFPLLWYCLRRADRGWSSRFASARLVVVTVDQAKMGEGTRGEGRMGGHPSDRVRVSGARNRRAPV